MTLNTVNKTDIFAKHHLINLTLFLCGRRGLGKKILQPSCKMLVEIRNQRSWGRYSSRLMATVSERHVQQSHVVSHAGLKNWWGAFGTVRLPPDKNSYDPHRYSMFTVTLKLHILWPPPVIICSAECRATCFTCFLLYIHFWPLAVETMETVDVPE